LDVGGTKTQGVVLADDLTQLAEASAPTRPGPAGVLASIKRVAELLGLPLDRPATVGVGIPGLVDVAAGRVRQAVNIGLGELDLATALARLTAAPVRVDNDVKATALGAAHALGLPGRDVVYVNIGTGIALAAVADGRLIRGRSNSAGEIGHLSVDLDGDLCQCGQRGCLETLAAGWAVSTRLARAGLDLTTLDRDPSPAARAEYGRLIHGVAVAVSVAALGFDPSTILLGGGVITTARGLVPRVVARLAKQEARSDLLAHLGLSRRVVQVPADLPVAAIGAALMGWRPSER
jgi:predicted NBD/HSP70 family sugar kinase